MQVCITVLDKCHRAHFEKSGRVRPVTHYGCYKCKKVYSLLDHPIKEWIDGGQTAMCPVCGEDCVVPKVRGANFNDHDLAVLHKQIFDSFE